MGIFSSIKKAIFGEAKAAEKPVEAAPAATPDVPPAVTETVAEPTAPVEPATQVDAPVAGGSEPVQARAATAPVDVAAIMDAAVKANGQKLDWRHSIVDMMKALDLDSSLSARKELATELNYTGDMNDSAKMNIWLHKALMKALAENGGHVPAELMD
jgi:hypothetical protein